MMKYFYVLCVMILTSDLVQGSDRYLMCKQVEEDIFSPCNETSSLQDGQGAVGPQGHPGVVDHEQINSTLEKFVDPVIQEMEQMKAAMNQMNSTLDELKEDISILKNFCGFKWNESCFWAVSHKSLDVNYAQGQGICAGRSAVMSYPRNKAHYNMIMNYLRSMIPVGNTFAEIWLGIKFNPSTEKATLSNGNPVPFVKYYLGYPYSTSAFTTIALAVESNSTSNMQGMFNDSPTLHFHAVLCEMKI